MLRLSDIMTTEIATVSPDATLRDAMELFAQRHVSGVPVVCGFQVVGVITSADLLEFAAYNPGVPTEQDGASDWGEWTEPTRDEEVEAEDQSASAFFSEYWDDAGVDASERMSAVNGPEWNSLEEHVVSEVMTRALVSLPPYAQVLEAAQLMSEKRIHRVLVMQDEILLGIVSSMDIARAVADERLAEPALPQ